MATDREAAAAKAAWRRRQQADLTPEERKRLNDERRNEYKRQRRAKARQEREQQAKAEGAVSKSPPPRRRSKKTMQQQEAQRRAEQAHRQRQEFISTSYRNGSRWLLKTTLPEAVVYSHDGYWVEEAPRASSLRPLSREDSEAMLARAHEYMTPDPDLLVRGYVLLREVRNAEHERKEAERQERWSEREAALRDAPDWQQRAQRQAPYRAREFTAPRVQRLIAAALEATLKGTPEDPFERSRGNLKRKSTVWDITAATTLIERMTWVLEAEALKFNEPDLAAVVEAYRASVLERQCAVDAGDVTLISPEEQQERREAFLEDALSLEDIEEMLSPEFQVQMKADTEERYNLAWVLMETSADAIERLEADQFVDGLFGSGMRPQDVERLKRALRREGGTPALRRYLRARRLHQQRGGGEVVADLPSSADIDPSEQHKRSNPQKPTLQERDEAEWVALARLPARARKRAEALHRLRVERAAQLRQQASQTDDPKERAELLKTATKILGEVEQPSHPNDWED